MAWAKDRIPRRCYRFPNTNAAKKDPYQKDFDYSDERQTSGFDPVKAVK